MAWKPPSASAVRARNEREKAAIMHADDLSIDLAADLISLPRHTVAQLMPVSGDHTELSVKANGAEYHYSCIDYVARPRPDEARGRRKIAEVPAGRRTELAYWSALTQEKKLTVHQGLGELVFARLRAEELETQTLSAEEGCNQAILPAGTFYTFVADAASPLVLSGFYLPPFKDWSDVEQEFLPGQQFVKLGEERVVVPKVFRRAFTA